MRRTAAAPDSPVAQGVVRIALLGNPNTGKTTLFNRLCGLKHKTSNFPGTTLDARLGFLRACSPDGPAAADGNGANGGGGEGAEGGGGRREHTIELVDLPGVYSLELDQLESRVVRDTLAGLRAPKGDPLERPDAVCIVADATNLARNLMLAGEVLRRGLPAVVAVNMCDLADRRGLAIDAAKLGERLGCRAVRICARTGEGLAELRAALVDAPATVPGQAPQGEGALRQWVDAAVARAVGLDPDAPGGIEAARGGRGTTDDATTDRVDRALTHPVLGLAAFALVMTGLFWVIFSLAQFPMQWIDALFGTLGALIERGLPPGDLRDFLSEGVVGGVGATVIFLPQICLLFLLISLLEDTGYLARAAFVMDRLLRPFGLSGHAFLPLLSSHACALPGIMAARAIPDRRERLAAILVAPFMSCTARIPVYVLLTSLLFPGRPAVQALAFTGCYALGAAAGVLSALIARRSILRGRTRAMALELPSYKAPSIRTSLVAAWDRGVVFLRKAGTAILAISIVLWWLGAYPVVKPPPAAVEMRARAAQLEAAEPGAPPAPADELLAEADRLEARHAQRNSFIGRIGSAIEPVLAPLGYDRQLAIGVLASFAAREVFVTTMAVVVLGDTEADVADRGVLEQLAHAKRDDGVTPIFTTATSWSLLVYYVLAMQCLPTLAVTAREAGGGRAGLKWAMVQLGWMCGIAYLAALVVYQVLA